MMQVRWTESAAEELRGIVRYIVRDRPDAAQRIARLIYEEVDTLHSMPHRGRPGPIPGTRELVLAPLPYIVLYEIVRDGVFILRIQHAAQRRPS
jgi:addiction module RelE/StbE family toxin